MTQTIRWGLLSTADINSKLIPAIRQSEGHELTAVASRDRARVDAYAAKWGIPRAFETYQSMLDDPDIDAVYISLPNHMHLEWVSKAAERGKHVLCEKPLALTPQEIEAIIAVGEKYQVVIMEAFMYRHHPRTLKVQEILAAGELGKVQHVSAHFTADLGRPGNYRWDPKAGGGSLWDVGCYPVSYSRMVMGENPLEVYGVWQLTDQGVDLHFTGQMIFSGGRTAQIFSSFGLPYGVYVEIFGDKAKLQNFSPYSPDEEHPLVQVENDVPRTIETAHPYLYQGEVENMGDAIHGKAKTRLSLQESLDINRILVALYEFGCQRSSHPSGITEASEEMGGFHCFWWAKPTKNNENHPFPPL